jgi:hypothetical protein
VRRAGSLQIENYINNLENFQLAATQPTLAKTTTNKQAARGCVTFWLVYFREFADRAASLIGRYISANESTSLDDMVSFDWLTSFDLQRVGWRVVLNRLLLFLVFDCFWHNLIFSFITFLHFHHFQPTNFRCL